MRSNPIARIIIMAAALTLLISSSVSAQIATPPPAKFGATLQSAVITNALDDATTNELVSETVHDYHVFLGGKDSGKKNGWNPVDSQASTDDVVQGVVDLAAGLKTKVIVISGGDGQATVGVAGNFVSTVFIDLGQPQPCVTPDGQPDPSGTCEGALLGVPVNYTAVDYAVEDGAYLAGILAAKKSSNDRLGVISGSDDCIECNRYIGGFINGARSIEPEIGIEIAYLADDEVSGFGDPASAKTFTKAFIDVFEPDVILPVGRTATQGMIEAACEAGIFAIGTGSDISAIRPDLKCIITSVAKDVRRGITDSLHAFAVGELEPLKNYDLANEGVAVTGEWERLTLPVDTATHFKEAETAIMTGQLEACPDGCVVPFGSTIEGAAEGAAEDGTPVDEDDTP